MNTTHHEILDASPRCTAAELRRRSDQLAATPCRHCGDSCTAQSTPGLCAFCEFEELRPAKGVR